MSEPYEKSYGSWAGNPKGTAPDFSRCCVSVPEAGRSCFFKQCGRKNGFGPKGAYCKQHDPEAVERKRKASDEAYRQKLNAERPKWHANTFLKTLRDIAAGHNDARGLAQQVIDDFDKGAW